MTVTFSPMGLSLSTYSLRAIHNILCVYAPPALPVVTDSCCKVRTPQSAAYLHTKYRFHISQAISIFPFFVWPCFNSTRRHRQKQRFPAVMTAPSRDCTNEGTSVLVQNTGDTIPNILKYHCFPKVVSYTCGFI